MSDLLSVSVIVFLPLVLQVSAFLVVTYWCLFVLDAWAAVITNLKGRR
jgi:hypothetical protein